jgi:signal transduction histidine kinase
MSKYFTFKLEIVPPFWKTKTFFLSLMALVSLFVWFFVRRVFKKKLKKQQVLASIQSHIDNERMRIAMELHDDIGGNLTALSLIGSLLKDKQMNEDAHGLVDKIIEASDQMVDDMNEIVWALNTSNDSLKSMMGYIRQHVSALLSNAGIKLELNEPIDYPNKFVSGRIRRNIFLIIKEISNNIVKHAFTKKVSITVHVNTKLEIIIVDYGIGIKEAHLTSGGGMGLHNLRERASEIGAKIQFKNEKGYTIYFSIPLNKVIMGS